MKEGQNINSIVQLRAAEEIVRQVQEQLKRGYGITMEHDEILVERGKRGHDQEMP